MLVANSDFSSSPILPRSPLIPNSVETLDESSSLVSSPNQDREGNNQVSTEEVSVPPQNSDESSPSAPLDETLIVPSPLRLAHGECSDATQVMTKPINLSKSKNTNLDMICLSESPDNRQRWSHNVSPGSDTDVDSENQPLCRFFRQEPPKIVEPTRVGVGLLNLGNSCFINSVLQCFTHTVPLIDSLYSSQYQDPCNCGNERLCVIRALRCHIGDALEALFSIAPFYFFYNLKYFSPDFRCYQQEDAHEFLHALLNKLEICCLNRRNDVNFVQHIFGGRLVSELRCCNCDYVSETFEDSLGLSLEIEDVDSLQSALDSFTRVEKLEEKMTCDNCEEKVVKEKQLLLNNLPEVITFHLKRFKNNGYFMQKNFNYVEFPLELDLQPYMSNNSQVATKYYLYALVKHYGSLAYGHYSSFVRSAPKIWHKFNDKQVTRVDEDCVLLQDAYILFYAREGTQWFSTVIEEFDPTTDDDGSSEYSSQKSVSDPTNEECSSEISSENVSKKGCGSAGVSDLLHVETEESCVSHSNDPKEDDDVLSQSEESSDEDSYNSMEVSLDPDDDSNDSCTEKEADSSLVIEKATSGVGFSPKLIDSSSKQPEGSFQIQFEQSRSTKNQEEESCKHPSLSLMKKPPPRDRELDQAMPTSGSAPKKLKKS